VPNGPKGQLFWGNGLQFGRDPLGFLERTGRDYGDAVQLRFGTTIIYLLSNPELIEAVLTNKADFPKSDLLRGPLMRRVAGNGIFLSEGEFWVRQRRLMQPSFHRERISAYARIMSQYSSRMCTGWTAGSTIHLQNEMMRLTLAIVNKALFNVEIHESRCKEVSAAFEEISNRIAPSSSLFRILLGSALRLGHAEFERAVRRLDNVINELISEHASSRQDSNDLLSTLMQARDEQGKRMTDNQLRDEVITLFLAGHETTAISLTWTIYLITQHPEVETRIINELDSELAGRTVQLEDVSKLCYLEKVIKEAMRLYPPVWVMARMSARDQALGSWSLPRGTHLFLSQWVVHRDARFYKNPKDFNPDRWTDAFTHNLPKYAYFPFGGGPRVCIGQSFAMLEVIIALATVFQNARLTVRGRQDIRPRPSLTLRPEGPIYMLVGKHLSKPDEGTRLQER